LRGKQQLPLENMLKNCFDEKEFMQNYFNCNSIYSVAKHDGKIVAFIRAEHDGQTFIQNMNGYIHINAAYCLPEHRGKGISQNLLTLLIQKLKKQGYTYLGVDYESINPSGFGFWLKDFSAYTYGVVRRIDESAIKTSGDK
jgi:ribosomal protein S18 acetylase RimI-like enzyme